MRIRLVLGLGLATLATGCRSTGLTHSGYLSDYERLARAPEERAREQFLAEGTDWSVYSAVLLEPLEIRLQTSSLDTLTDEQVETLKAHYRSYLHDALNDELEIARAPGARTIVVHSALTEVDTILAPLNWITGFGILWPVDVGGATLEVELLDGATGAQLAAIVNADKATLWNAIQAMRPIGHACQALEETADWVGAAIAARPAAEL